jgi:hypothetical protein
VRPSVQLRKLGEQRQDRRAARARARGDEALEALLGLGREGDACAPARDVSGEGAEDADLGEAVGVEHGGGVRRGDDQTAVGEQEEVERVEGRVASEVENHEVGREPSKQPEQLPSLNMSGVRRPQVRRIPREHGECGDAGRLEARREVADAPRQKITERALRLADPEEQAQVGAA